MQDSHKRRLIELLFLAALAATIVVWHHRAETPNARWDFQEFYMAAQIVRHGEAHRLYDFATQAAFQARYVAPTHFERAPDLPFLYPAAAVIPFLPLTALPLTPAYALWTMLNLLFLYGTIRLLQREAILPENNWPLFAAVASAPVIGCLLNGQVSLLILFICTVALTLFRRNQLFLAGLVVGLASLKFQLILGLGLVLLLRRAWKMVFGTGVGTAIMVVLSFLIAGWHQMLNYPVFLRSAAYHPRFGPPATMVNLRGLLWWVEHHEPQVWLVIGLSVLILGLAALAWNDDTVGICVALTASVFVGYHVYINDLSLLFLPYAVAVAGVGWTENRTAVTLISIPVVTFGFVAFGLYQLEGAVAAGLCLGLLISRPSAVMATQSVAGSERAHIAAGSN
ncbi:MAG: glycosyltransferase family 87 protein [Terriglobales bacterium]